MKSEGQLSYEILVVDDEPAVRLSIKLLLEHDGHDVSAVENGYAALEQLAQRKFDIVITDFCMPEMRGDELVARIRHLSPNQPIILVSAFVDETNFGRSSGQVNAFLPKPFTRKLLKEVVDRTVRRSKT